MSLLAAGLLAADGNPDLGVKQNIHIEVFRDPLPQDRQLLLCLLVCVSFLEIHGLFREKVGRVAARSSTGSEIRIWTLFGVFVWLAVLSYDSQSNHTADHFDAEMYAFVALMSRIVRRLRSAVNAFTSAPKSLVSVAVSCVLIGCLQHARWPSFSMIQLVYVPFLIFLVQSFVVFEAAVQKFEDLPQEAKSLLKKLLPTRIKDVAQSHRASSVLFLFVASCFVSSLCFYLISNLIGSPLLFSQMLLRLVEVVCMICFAFSSTPVVLRVSFLQFIGV